VYVYSVPYLSCPRVSKTITCTSFGSVPENLGCKMWRMSKHEPPESAESASSIGDPRIFRLAITCRYCGLSYHTLQAARMHFATQCPQKLAPKIRCGCCGSTFRNWGRCAAHLNIKLTHLRKPIRSIVISSTSSSDAESR